MKADDLILYPFPTKENFGNLYQIFLLNIFYDSNIILAIIVIMY